jgi:hypothetical protein
MKALVAPFILVAALFLTLTTSFAQTAPGVLRWAEGAPNATSDVKEGVKIEGVKTDDLHVYVSMADIKQTEFNRVWVQIANHSKAPIDFNPDSAVLLKGDKGVKAEVPDKAAKSIQKFGEAKSQELSSAHCNMMTATGCQPTNTQMQMSKQVAAESGQQAEWVRSNGLKQKTLAPGDEIQGAIVFRKDKKFPLSAQNKAPSYD